MGFMKSIMPTSTGITLFTRHVDILPYVRYPLDTLEKNALFLKKLHGTTPTSAPK
jgi:hypothetical protein